MSKRKPSRSKLRKEYQRWLDRRPWPDLRSGPLLNAAWMPCTAEWYVAMAAATARVVEVLRGSFEALGGGVAAVATAFRDDVAVTLRPFHDELRPAEGYFGCTAEELLDADYLPVVADWLEERGHPTVRVRGWIGMPEATEGDGTGGRG